MAVERGEEEIGKGTQERKKRKIIYAKERRKERKGRGNMQRNTGKKEKEQEICKGTQERKKRKRK